MSCRLLLAVFFLAALLHAGVIVTQPAGMAPGTYRLVFVTSTGRDALSPNIDDYNAFVQAAADSVPELFHRFTWRAIVSTATVDARDNIGPDLLPIYNFAGERVADNTDDLWSGTLLEHLIFTTELGSAPPSPWQVWTGTTLSGIADPLYPVGTPTVTRIGSANHDNPPWIYNFAAGAKPSSELRLIYGITIPEPGTALLVLAGFGCLLACRRKIQ